MLANCKEFVNHLGEESKKPTITAGFVYDVLQISLS